MDTTGYDDLYYLGHSQGGTSFLVMTSMRPEYNAKIRVANLLGPAAFMDDMKSPFLQIIAQYEEDLEVSGSKFRLTKF